MSPECPRQAALDHSKLCRNLCYIVRVESPIEGKKRDGIASLSRKTGGNFRHNGLRDCTHLEETRASAVKSIKSLASKRDGSSVYKPSDTPQHGGAIRSDDGTMRSTPERRKERNGITRIGHFSLAKVNGPARARALLSSRPAGTPRGGQPHKDVRADKNI